MDVNKLHETLNTRAYKILEIQRHFRSVKVPIDLSYLDSIDDKMLEGIYDMVKREEK